MSWSQPNKKKRIRYVLLFSNDKDLNYMDSLTDFFVEDIRLCAKVEGMKYSPCDFWKLSKDKVIQEANDFYNGVLTTYPRGGTLVKSLFYLTRSCHLFRCSITVCILEMFNATNILDPSGGWGCRLLGAISYSKRHPNKNICYTSIDPNEKLHSRYNSIIKETTTTLKDVKFRQQNKCEEDDFPYRFIDLQSLKSSKFMYSKDSHQMFQNMIDIDTTKHIHTSNTYPTIAHISKNWPQYEFPLYLTQSAARNISNNCINDKDSKTHNNTKQFATFCGKFETCGDEISSRGPYDVIFTSPPFYNREIYEQDNKNQSHYGNQSVDDWLHNFFYKYLSKAWDLLMENGYLVLSINDFTTLRSHKHNNICLPMNRYLRDHCTNSKYVGCLPFHKSRVSAKNHTSFTSPQPIWIWQKCIP